MVLGHPDWGEVVVEPRVCRTSLADQGLPVPRRRAHRHHHHAVHAAVPGGGRRRPRHRPGRVPDERIDSISGSIFANFISDLDHHRHRRRHRRHRPARRRPRKRPRRSSRSSDARAEALFGIGLLGASALAAAVVPLSTAYAVAEAVGAERSVSRRFRGGAAVPRAVHRAGRDRRTASRSLPGNLIDLLINMQMLNGLITPVILTFILILANRRSVLGDAANGPKFKIVATICVVVVSVLAAVVLVLTVLGWFGLA